MNAATRTTTESSRLRHRGQSANGPRKRKSGLRERSARLSRNVLAIRLGQLFASVAIPRHRLIGIGLEQLVEERAVAAHGLPQVLRRIALALRARLRETMAFAIVLDDPRVIDGEVARALLEVLDGIPALG